MLVIVDYGVGNLGSILNMLKKAGEKAVISGDPKVLAEAKRIILPGVGAFDFGMQKLREAGVVGVLNQKVLEEKVPVLGICLGMQMLADSSEEGNETGLGWIKGRCVKFQLDPSNPAHARLKIPQMGWNDVKVVKPGGIYTDMYESPRFYFVHSYHLQCEDPSDVIATASYGIDFTCSVRRNNISGVQFHPEKSHKFGLRILKNFATL